MPFHPGGASSLVLCRTRSLKEKISFLLNAPGDRIKENLIQRSEILREKFAQPLFPDARDLREQDDQFVIPSLDFANLAGHEQRALLHDAFPSEDPVSAMDKIAAKRPGIDAFGQMIRKSNQHAFSKCFGIEFIDFFVDVQALGFGRSRRTVRRPERFAG